MVPSQSDGADAPEGLRERRRRETLRDVSDAAVELFERRGVAATTVEEIARTAGIGLRTFFRYFPTKEHAAFLDDEVFSTVRRETVDAIRDGAPVVAALDAGWVRVCTEFDARPEERDRALRVRRLIQREPGLLAHALAIDAEHIEELTATAVEAAGPDADPLATRAAIALVSTVARLSFDEWVRRAEEGTPASVREVYVTLRRSIAELDALPPV